MSNVSNPLKEVVLIGHMDVDTSKVKEILEDQAKSRSIKSWLDAPLDLDGVGCMPSALIYATGNGLGDLVELLLKFGANPNQVYRGTNQFNGWIRPDCKLSEQLMSRAGRFKGTMLGDKYQRILELLQAAEFRVARSSHEGERLNELQQQGKLEDMFEVRGEIGRGATSSTRLGIRKDTGDRVAIKYESTSVEAGTWEEVALMRKLSHENIVKLYNTFEDDKHVYVVMELCSGSCLFHGITTMGGVSLHANLKLMRQMAEAVGYLHRNHICHRSIYPEHFLLKDEKRLEALRLVDFKFARDFSSGRPPLTLLEGDTCALQCLAPELLRSLGATFTEKVDIWSLGVVFYFMIGGGAPFIGDSERSILRKITKGLFDFTPSTVWSDSLPQAKQLVQGMLVVDEQSRFSAQSVLDHALFSVVPTPEHGQQQSVLGDTSFLGREQLETLYDFKTKLISVSSNLLSELSLKKDLHFTRQSVRQENPLKVVMSSRKVDIKQLRAVLDATDDRKLWIDTPLEVNSEKPVPTPLIFAIGNTLNDVVKVLIEYGADPFQAHAGQTSYMGWIKPGVHPSEAVMGRLGRFVGTHLGEKLQQMCELLLAAEAASASANVSSVCSKISRTVGHPSSTYEIQLEIGAGISSVTRIGVHRASGESFAVKADSKSKEAVIWEEIALLGQLSHERVAKLHETFEDDTQVYMVLDLCSGGTVTKRAPEMVGLHMNGVMQQMADVLQYIHRLNICHRDVHGDHFVIEQSTCDLCDAKVKLIDFTLAKEFSDSSPMMTRLRSCAYSAPEAREKLEFSYDERIDVWSLAVVFSFMVCGSEPGGDDDTSGDEGVVEIPSQPPGLWSSVSSPMKDLISKMLVIDAKARLSSAQVYEQLST
jgi:serine/threonine protein kinase